MQLLPGAIGRCVVTSKSPQVDVIATRHQDGERGGRDFKTRVRRPIPEDMTEEETERTVIGAGWCWRKERVDEPGAIVPTTAEGIRVVRRGWTGFHEAYCLREVR